MSVYTTVNEDQLRTFIQPLDVGELTGFQGIEGGVVNSNFFIDTSKGRFVLTLFEELEAEDLPFYIELNGFLADKGLPCTRAIADKDGEVVFELNDRPACLFTRLPGHHLGAASADHCFAMGQTLGKFHRFTADFPQTRQSDRDTKWFEASVKRVLPLLEKADAELLSSEREHHRQHPLDQLPSGIIHADLFRDNVLFENDKLSGLLDFYFACTGSFLYDLAITANDWCSMPQGGLEDGLSHALLEGYQSERSLTKVEINAWGTALRLAGLRFWLSRLLESLFPAEGELVLIKDPNAFKRIVQHRRQMSAG